MGQHADDALDELANEDDAQMDALGYSNVHHGIGRRPPPKRCPACGAAVVVREGRNGPFAGCSAFPACKAGGTWSLAPPRPLDDRERDVMGMW